MKNFKRISLFTLLLICCLAVSAQDAEQHKRDSMIGLLRTSKPDTNKVKLLNRIGDEYAYSDIPTARKYYSEAFTLSEKLDFTKGIIRYYSSEGELLNIEGKYSATIALLRKGVELSTQKNDKMRLGIMYENIGNTFGLMEKPDSALHYYLQSLSIFESYSDTVKMANVYTNLSAIFIKTDNEEKALMYAEKALDVSAKNKDGFYLSGLINKENILWKLKRFDESDKINNEIISLAKEQMDNVALADALQNFCSHSLEKKRYTELYNYALQLNAVSQSIAANDRLAVADYWMATANYYQKDLGSAEFYAEGAIKKAELDSNAGRMKTAYLLYSKIILAKKGDVFLADYYSDKADSIERVTLNETIIKATHETEAKYETGKKEARIKQQAEELAQKKKMNLILICALALVITALIFFGLWIRNRQRLSENEKLLQQQKILQLEKEKQLEATKSVLKGQEEERSRLARDLHDGLGGILSGAKYSFNHMKQNFVLTEENAIAFEKSMAMLDQSISELRRVAHNMMPESLMKLTLDEALRDYCEQVEQNGGLAVTYQSFGMEDFDAESTVKTTVYRIVQELINNAVKHASAGKALVQVIVKDHTMNITVEDDGKGFDPSTISTAEGIGYKNIKSRIAFLKGNFDLRSMPGEGTFIYIDIPL